MPAGELGATPNADGCRETTMKITRPIDLVDGSKPAANAGTGRANGNAAPVAGTPIGTRDSVRLSTLSTQMHALETSLAAGGEFDRTRVEAIKQAIRDGKLSVNADVIADRMLASDLALLTGKSA